MQAFIRDIILLIAIFIVIKVYRPISVYSYHKHLACLELSINVEKKKKTLMEWKCVCYASVQITSFSNFLKKILDSALFNI